MLIRFCSSETGEVLMYADIAKVLLQIVGKECTARGVFTQSEMLPAAALLRQAVAGQTAVDSAEEDEEGDRGKPPAVGLNARAWPLIDMLERTARAGAEANVIWEAPADF